jgi:hypothetical protein
MADKLFIEKFETEMNKFASEIEKLKEKASEGGKSASSIGDIVAELQEQHNILKFQIKELKKTGESAAEDLQLGVEKHLKELTMNLNTAMSKFKSSS